MPDEKSESGAAKELALKAGVELAKHAYEDGAQPLVRNVGQLIALPFRLLNASLSNVYALLTDREARQRALEKGMTERWAKIPSDRLVPPPPSISGPLLLGYAFVQSDADAPLRELYEQLLASAMDSTSQPVVHPAFVEMLRQMTPTEARIVQTLAADRTQLRGPLIRMELLRRRDPRSALLNVRRVIGIRHAFPEGVFLATDNVDACLLNLERLGLVAVTFDEALPDDSVYVPLRAVAEEALAAFPKGEDDVPHLSPGQVTVTELGQRFIEACIGASGE